MATTKQEIVTIKRISRPIGIIRIVGETPLIVNAWNEKGKRMLKAGQADRGEEDITKKTEYAGRWESFINSMYWISHKPTEYTKEAFMAAIDAGAEFGFRVEAFKCAALDAAYSKKWVPNKKGLKGLFFIKPDFVDEDGNQLVKIHGDPPVMREDVVILSGIGRKPDLRWRGQFTNWYCDLQIQYDKDGVYKFQDICNMIEAGGSYNGIGEYRPEKDGQFGMYYVDTSNPGK